MWRRGGRFDRSIGATKTRWRAAAVLNTHLELRMMVVSCVVKVESYCRASNIRLHYGDPNKSHLLQSCKSPRDINSHLKILCHFWKQECHAHQTFPAHLSHEKFPENPLRRPPLPPLHRSAQNCICLPPLPGVRILALSDMGSVYGAYFSRHE